MAKIAPFILALIITAASGAFYFAVAVGLGSLIDSNTFDNLALAAAGILTFIVLVVTIVPAFIVADDLS